MLAQLALFAASLAVIGGLAAMGWRLLDRPARVATNCPAALGNDGARAALAAFDAIQADLRRGSMQNLGPRAALIADFFEPVNTEIAGCARRLAGLRDLAAAREEFARLSGLFVPSPARPAPTPPRA
jgi:hypothetical protein